MKILQAISLRVFSLVIFIAFISCDSTSEVTPSCISDKINEIKSQKLKNPPGIIWQYFYNGQTVYYVNGLPNIVGFILLDENCLSICIPDDPNKLVLNPKCSDFLTARTNEKLIWVDDRK